MCVKSMARCVAVPLTLCYLIKREDLGRKDNTVCVEPEMKYVGRDLFETFSKEGGGPNKRDLQSRFLHWFLAQNEIRAAW